MKEIKLNSNNKTESTFVSFGSLNASACSDFSNSILTYGDGKTRNAVNGLSVKFFEVGGRLCFHDLELDGIARSYGINFNLNGITIYGKVTTTGKIIDNEILYVSPSNDIFHGKLESEDGFENQLTLFASHTEETEDEEKSYEYPDVDEGSAKKILALHGGGESSASFRNQQGIIDLMNAMPDIEFVFADAPLNNVWMQDPPNGKGEPTTDSSWADDSINYLDELVSQHGPFFGILGYSQGAAFIPVYLSKTSHSFQVALMYNGYLPTTHLGLINSINEVAPFKIPSVVFSGENDTDFKDLAPELASKFEDSQYIRSSSSAHHLPTQSDSTFSQILNFITNLESPNLEETPTPTKTITKEKTENEVVEDTPEYSDDEYRTEITVDNIDFNESGIYNQRTKLVGIEKDKMEYAVNPEKNDYIKKNPYTGEYNFVYSNEVDIANFPNFYIPGGNGGFSYQFIIAFKKPISIKKDSLLNIHFVPIGVSFGSAGGARNTETNKPTLYASDKQILSEHHAITHSWPGCVCCPFYSFGADHNVGIVKASDDFENIKYLMFGGMLGGCNGKPNYRMVLQSFSISSLVTYTPTPTFTTDLNCIKTENCNDVGLLIKSKDKQPYNLITDDSLFDMEINQMEGLRYSKTSDGFKDSNVSIKFDGNCEYLYSDDTDNFDGIHLKNNDFTIEAWIKLIAPPTPTPSKSISYSKSPSFSKTSSKTKTPTPTPTPTQTQSKSKTKSPTLSGCYETKLPSLNQDGYSGNGTLNRPNNGNLATDADFDTVTGLYSCTWNESWQRVEYKFTDATKTGILRIKLDLACTLPYKSVFGGKFDYYVRYRETQTSEWIYLLNKQLSTINETNSTNYYHLDKSIELGRVDKVQIYIKDRGQGSPRFRVYGVGYICNLCITPTPTPTPTSTPSLSKSKSQTLTLKTIPTPTKTLTPIPTPTKTLTPTPSISLSFSQQKSFENLSNAGCSDDLIIIKEHGENKDLLGISGIYKNFDFQDFSSMGGAYDRFSDFQGNFRRQIWGCGMLADQGGEYYWTPSTCAWGYSDYAYDNFSLNASEFQFFDKNDQLTNCIGEAKFVNFYLKPEIKIPITVQKMQIVDSLCVSIKDFPEFNGLYVANDMGTRYDLLGNDGELLASFATDGERWQWQTRSNIFDYLWEHAEIDNINPNVNQDTPQITDAFVSVTGASNTDDGVFSAKYVWDAFCSEEHNKQNTMQMFNLHNDDKTPSVFEIKYRPDDCECALQEIDYEYYVVVDTQE